MTQDDAIKFLKTKIKKGSILYTQLNHVSSSGMTRHISVRQIKNNYPLNWDYQVSIAVGIPIAKNRFGGQNGLKIGGCGMDMGFHLIYTLSQKLFDDGYAIKQKWL